MLKIIFDNGETDTNTIAEKLNIKNGSVDCIGKQLRSMGYIKKRVKVKKDLDNPGLVRKKSIWSIREQRREKTISLINENFGGEE